MKEVLILKAVHAKQLMDRSQVVCCITNVDGCSKGMWFGVFFCTVGGRAV